MTTSCPDCGVAAPAGARICPACGFPLVVSPRAQESSPTPLDLVRKPGDAGVERPVLRLPGSLPGAGRAPGAGPQPPVRPVNGQFPTVRLPTTVAGTMQAPAGWAGPPGPGAGPGACRSCGHVSALTRVRCERCGAVLPEQRPAFPGPSARGPLRPARRRPRWPLFAAAATVAACAIGAGLVAGLRGGDDAAAAGGTQVGTDPVGAAVTVPRDTIRGSASSTLRNSSAYGIANTLDADPGTAWNSDGKRDGTGKGVTLTYRFDRPRHLTQITLINGYLRSRRITNVWQANGRVHRLRLTTATGSREADLTDVSQPQTLKLDLGTTRSLKITVLSVYPGARFKDLALTEIAFKAVPGPS